MLTICEFLQRIFVCSLEILFPYALIYNKKLLTFDNSYGKIPLTKEEITMYTSISAKVTLWANRIISLILALLIFTMPELLRWYETIRIMEPGVTTAISVAFYCCCIPVAAALWDMDAILRNILRKEIFVRKNVSCIRRIRWRGSVARRQNILRARRVARRSRRRPPRSGGCMRSAERSF